MVSSANAHELEIRELLDRMSLFFEGGNWNEYQNCWSHESNVELIHPSFPEWLVGWPQVQGVLEPRTAQNQHLSAKRLFLRINVSKSGDMAWATSASEITVGEDRSILKVWNTTVLEKQDGTWHVVHGHASVPEEQDQ